MLSIYAITSKIDKWWIREIELSTMSEFDDKPLTEEQLDQSFSNRMLMMSFLVQIAEGDDPGLAAIYAEWKKRFPGERTSHYAEWRLSMSVGDGATGGPLAT